MRADPDTQNRVALVLAKAKTRGADPVRALDELGFLLYPDRERMIESKVLTEVVEVLEQVSASALLGARRSTVQDMKDAILEFISKRAQ